MGKKPALPNIEFTIEGANPATNEVAIGLKYFLPIRFLPMTTTNRRMLPNMLIQFVVGWSRYLTADTKQGAEGIMWVKSPVKSERKLIQVGL